MDLPASATTDPDTSVVATSANADVRGSKRVMLMRLRRIEGQVRGIARMVDGDANCLAILTQVAAATHALEAVAVVMVDQHLRHCLEQGAAASLPSERADQVDQAIRAIERLLRAR